MEIWIGVGEVVGDLVRRVVVVVRWIGITGMMVDESGSDGACVACWVVGSGDAAVVCSASGVVVCCCAGGGVAVVPDLEDVLDCLGLVEVSPPPFEPSGTTDVGEPLDLSFG